MTKKARFFFPPPGFFYYHILKNLSILKGATKNDWIFCHSIFMY